MSRDDPWSVRLLVTLYPPTWRARYGDEFAALLLDLGLGWATVVNTVTGAAAAWARPSRRLHDPVARQSATVGVTLCAWTALAAGAVLFAKVAADGAMSATGPGGGWYDAFAASAFVSALTVLAAGVPLAVTTVRRAPAQARGPVALLLTLPVIVPAGFLALAAVLTAVARHGAPTHPGIGAPSILVLTGLFLAAAAACAAGPALAVTRVRPGGATLTAAVVAGATAIALMGLATACALASALVRTHQASAGLIGYGLVMATALGIGLTSGWRALPACRPMQVRR